MGSSRDEQKNPTELASAARAARRYYDPIRPLDPEIAGDCFPPAEILKSLANAPERVRRREDARLAGDARRPQSATGAAAASAAAAPPGDDAAACETTQSWDFGADPMLWARTRYGAEPARPSRKRRRVAAWMASWLPGGSASRGADRGPI